MMMEEDKHCPFYSAERHICIEVEGMKKIVKWGIGIIITVFLGCFGYFAHNQDKRNDLLMQMNKEVISLQKLIEYKVLPKLEHEREADF